MKMNTVVLPILLFVLSTVGQSQSAGSCGVVPIEAWGGSSLNRDADLSKPVKIVVIQHTVTNECTTDDACENIVRNIRNNQKLLGMADIAQSFIVGGNGKVYEGAGWKQGEHTLDYNDRSISISFVGDYRVKLPNALALQAARDFLSCSVHNADLDIDYSLVGHQQLSETLSPGAALQCFIQTWPQWQADASDL